MIAVVWLAILACASAVPHYHRHHHHHHSYHDYDTSFEDFMERDVFDAKAFWGELRRDMMGLKAMIADFYKHYPVNTCKVKVDENKYQIILPLSGFTENEITIKAKKGLLIIQAVHHAWREPEHNYLDVRTLPDNVDLNGKWSYQNGLLTVTFTIVKNYQVKVTTVTEAPVTTITEDNREGGEVYPGVSDSQDANAEVPNRGDLGQAILTNEIDQVRNTVEATTYAVDLKDELELVPIPNRVY